ncbi:nucleotidyl transferase AbiEii/AbiGii toxin family protein [Mesorhizobium sp. 2RAF21]|uniref:nucleotidyl transferase AbiEii/AbiGii toxin family protein n=1 Tax=Mesorhizobium sp. 2RAF21 TaxID=3232995 RepID=UPI003F9AFB3D
MNERHEGMPDWQSHGRDVSAHIHEISNNHGLDSRMAMARYVCETILSTLQDVSESDFMVGGGLLHPQSRRQTDNGDILYFTPRTAADISDDIDAAEAHIRQHGIRWLPGEIGSLRTDGKDASFRIPVKAKVGPTSVDTHLNIGFATLPHGAVRREFRSIFGAPSFTAWAQPWEAEAAEKLAAILTADMANRNMRDYADLLVLSGKDLDLREVARAVYRTMRERKADTALLLGVPHAFSFKFAGAQTLAWCSLAAVDRHLPANFTEVVYRLRGWYLDLQNCLVDLASADALEPRNHLVAPASEPDSIVYDFAAYRRMRA